MSRLNIGELLKQNGYIVMTIVLLATVLLPVFSNTKVFASGETFNGGADVSGAVGQAITIDDLSISGTGDDTLDVNLYVPNGTLQMSTMTGLTFSSATSGSELQFSGTRSTINTALTTLTFTHNEPVEVTLQVTLGGADGEVYNPANGHVYQVVSTGGINWDDANTAALATEYNGSTGYLATITSQEESDFIVSRLDNDGWIGASDAATEGDWKWVVGPEAGTSFWSGGIGGSAVDGAFTNWNYPYQPDNAGEEECGQIVIGASGRWNDLTCANTLTYYVVEFGAPGDLPTNASTEIEVSVTGAQISVDNCDELEAIDDNAGSQYARISLTADIDCEEREITSLFEDAPFEGSIDGNNHTIKNFIINKEGDEAGLFAKTTGDVTIGDLTLENVSVTAEEEAGALIGYIDGAFTINNVHASEVVVSTTFGGYTGGLIGSIDASEGVESEITNVSAKGDVHASGPESSNVGGLIGMVEAQKSIVTIQKVYADVGVVNEAAQSEDFTDFSDVGGLFGELEADNDSGDGEATETSVTLQDAYAWGSVTAEDSLNVAGLVGRLDVEDDASDDIYITVENTYARGDVTGLGNAGGLVGLVDDADNSEVNYNVSSSFTMGEVERLGEDEDAGTGGVFGKLEAGNADQLLSEDNYYDQQRTDQTVCNWQVTVSECTAVNTDGSQAGYFIDNTTNPPLNDWNFSGVWVTNNDVPPTFAPYVTNEDLNDDNIEDSYQPNVGGYINSITGKIVAIDVGEGCELTTDDTTRESAFAVQDPAYDYADGLWDFEADCGAPGYTTTIKLYYYDVSPNGRVLRKHNPVTNAYFTINDATISTQTIDGHTVTVASYQVTDGGIRDIDGLVDGMLKDPAGLAQATIGAPNTGL